MEAEPGGSAGLTQNLNGCGGLDTASYPGSAPVKANLTTGFSTGQGSDALVGIEKPDGFGGRHLLTGSSVANSLVGGKGVDKMFGLAGNDTLNSRDGSRNDRVDGGARLDRCVTDAKESLIKSCE